MDLTVDNIVKLPVKQKVYILVALLVTIAGLYVYLGYMPKSAKLSVMQEELTKLEAELKESMAVAADLQKFKDEVKRLDEELKNALLELPDKKEIPSLLTNISNLGTESGLEFLRFKPLPEIPEGFYAKVPVEISVKGNFYDVAAFFDKVGKLPRIVNMSEITISGFKYEGGRNVLTTSCLATTYRFIEGEAVKKDEGKK